MTWMLVIVIGVAIVAAAYSFEVLLGHRANMHDRALTNTHDAHMQALNALRAQMDEQRMMCQAMVGAAEERAHQMFLLVERSVLPPRARRSPEPSNDPPGEGA